MTRRRIVEILIVTALFLGSLWAFNLAAFNWWAAGGPPTADPQGFEARGNFFGIAGLLLLVTTVILGYRVARRR
jgi:hypothetical protein